MFLRQKKLTLAISVMVIVAVGVWFAYKKIFEEPDVNKGIDTPFTGLMEQEKIDNPFKTVAQGVELQFPRDHGEHPGYRVEWWYITGNLATDSGEHFGFQFTIFRRATSSEESFSDSDWKGTQVYIAHVAVTDVQANEYLHDELFSRGALGLAGAQADPFYVWVNNWFVKGSQGQCYGCLDFSIQMSSENFAFDLQLSSVKPVVLQDDRGFSRKNDVEGSASYYYTLSRLETNGTLTVRGKANEVSGYSWMDHEWFSTVLGDDQVGWDWYSLQLDDQRELTLFQVRRNNPEIEPFKYGILIDQQGNTELLTPNQIILTPLTTWKSELSETTYPIHWQVSIPHHDMTLEVEALIEGQERVDSFQYWEGAIRITGKQGSKPITGFGYLEMTGYEKP